MPGVVVSDAAVGHMIEVKIASDPFTCFVERKQVELVKQKSTTPNEKKEHKMPTATAKELRKQAKAAGIDGWEEMDREELEEALADAEVEDEVEDEEVEEEVEEAPAPRTRRATKTTATKAPAKKAPAAKKSAGTRPATKKAAATTAASKKAAPAKASTRKAAAAADDEEEGDNPFRTGSNLFLMTEELMKGGKRSQMVRRLERKIELNPRSRGGRDFDAAEEIDYRLVRVCQVLTNEHGFVIEKDGRGKDQVVKAIPPSAQ